MKALHEKVNIVPLIAKADCLVPSEIRKLKDRVSLLSMREAGQKLQRSWPVPSQALTPPLQIREEIDKFGIHVYQFPECDSDEDEDFKQQDRELKVSMQPGRVKASRGTGCKGLEASQAQAQHEECRNHLFTEKRDYMHPPSHRSYRIQAPCLVCGRSFEPPLGAH